MKPNYKSLVGFFGFIFIVGAVLLAHFHETALIRQQNLAARHFELLAQTVCAEARAQISEQTASGVQNVIKAGSSVTVGGGTAELTYNWEIAPKSSGTSNVNLQIIAESIEAKLQQITTDEQSALSYYYPKMQISVGATVVDSKFFNKPAILVSLKCNS